MISVVKMEYKHLAVGPLVKDGDRRPASLHYLADRRSPASPTLPLPLALVEQRPYTHICTLVAVLLCGCTPLLYSSVDDFAVHILQLH